MWLWHGCSGVIDGFAMCLCPLALFLGKPFLAETLAQLGLALVVETPSQIFGSVAENDT